MKLLSINTGQKREIEYNGRHISTGIFKTPVNGPISLHHDNIEGDVQADRRTHGGTDKAVYAYPYEHYAYWADRLGQDSFDFGRFGENLTIAGLTEDSVFIGDTLHIGNTVLQVAQPRSPCFKLDLCMGLDGFMKDFIDSGRAGFYLRVLEPGLISVNSEIELVRSGRSSVTIAEAFALRFASEVNPDRLRLACELPALADSWRAKLEHRLVQAD